ncbi:MAG: restriction endonuclease [Spirochaetes bacterium]|nr:restriction endonuclease [Spirochaetota bacterium]
MITWVILAIFLSAILGAILGFIFINKFFSRKVYTPKNAIDLLKLGRPEEWNEVRTKNPEWTPSLIGYDLSNISIPSSDFRNAILDKVNFSRSNLEGCQFNQASLVGTDFSYALLTDASFDEANLKNSKLEGAKLIRTSFQDVKLEGVKMPDVDETPEPEQRKFNSTKSIIQDAIENPSLLDNLSPKTFEKLVASVFHSMGYKITLTPPVRDGGYDMMLEKDDPVSPIKAIVEVKKYSPGRKIGLATLREIAGVAMLNNVNIAILVTSNYLTKQALEFVGSIPTLQVIDRNRFIELISKYGINGY